MPWVLVRAANGLFGLSSHYVHEMVSTPPVTSVPHAPEYVRGLINLRGQVMPLVDLRRRFGFKSHVDATNELIQLLEAREQDHHRWLNELVASVREQRAFKLTTDPHACAFGKWYDTFKTDNLLLETVLKRFDQPHQAIHGIGRQVVDLMARGAFADCDALIDGAKVTLQGLVRLFAEAQSVVLESSREIAVVLKGAGPTFAVAVDGIESVERMAHEAVSSMDEALAIARSECVESVARRARDGSLVLTVRADRLLDQPVDVTA